MSDYWKEMNAQPATGAATTTEFLVPTNQKLGRQINTAAGWLWVMAGLSAINLLLLHLDAPIRMMVDVFAVDLLFAVGRELGPVFLIAALVAGAVLIGFFTFLGFQTKAGRVWAFVTAIVLISLDAVLIYFTTDLGGIGPFLIHGFAIYLVAVGLKAAKLRNHRKSLGKA